MGTTKGKDAAKPKRKLTVRKETLRDLTGQGHRRRGRSTSSDDGSGLLLVEAYLLVQHAAGVHLATR